MKQDTKKKSLLGSDVIYRNELLHLLEIPLGSNTKGHHLCKYIQIRHCHRILASCLHGLQGLGLSALALPSILGGHSPVDTVKASLPPPPRTPGSSDEC